MPYSTPDDIRTYFNLTVEDAPDALLNKYIATADKHLIDLIVQKYVDKELKKLENLTFSTEVPFIADINADSVVDASDVEVLAWITETDKQVLTVTSIDWLRGWITVESLPETYKKVTANFSAYTGQIDWEVLKLAHILLSGWLYGIREFAFVAETTRIGSLTLTFRGIGRGFGGRGIQPITDRFPYTKIYELFRRVLSLLIKKPIGVSIPEKLKIIEREEEILR